MFAPRFYYHLTCFSDISLPAINNVKEKSPKIFGTLKNTSYLCSVKGTYLRWEPRLVRQATHKIEALFNSASDG